MIDLVIGPTCSGKTTYIESVNKNKNIYFGFQLSDREVPNDGILHYNLLYKGSSFDGEIPTEWDLISEPILRKIVGSEKVGRAVVVVSPKSELMQRAAQRTIVEASLPETGRYSGALWSSVIERVDLFALYERLFSILDDANIPIEVVYSSAEFCVDGQPRFLPSDRVLLHQNLRGVFVSRPSMDSLDLAINVPGFEYQSVLLPRGLITGLGGHSHVAGGRSRSFELFRDRSFIGRSVLDIGCALGDMLFRSERYGATCLVGVERKDDRWRAATSLAFILHSRAYIHKGDFLDIEFERQFDDVLLMNVLHHVSDFRAFLEKAVLLSGQRLIIEFPNFKDGKFRSLGRNINEDDEFPIIYVSSNRVDQTFIYSKRAIIDLIAEFGNFTHRLFPSPIEGRDVLIFERS